MGTEKEKPALRLNVSPTEPRRKDNGKLQTQEHTKRNELGLSLVATESSWCWGVEAQRMGGDPRVKSTLAGQVRQLVGWVERQKGKTPGGGGTFPRTSGDFLTFPLIAEHAP